MDFYHSFVRMKLWGSNLSILFNEIVKNHMAITDMYKDSLMVLLSCSAGLEICMEHGWTDFA